MSDDPRGLPALTAKIVGAFAGKNPISPADLSALIHAVHGALRETARPEVEPAPKVAKLTPAQIRRSITPDALISFIDGKSYRMLKRHLTTHGLTIAGYKEMFGLPKDYPTTAPGYSAARSALAKAAGLGRGGKRPQSEEAAEAPPAPVRRARPKKAVDPLS